MMNDQQNSEQESVSKGEYSNFHDPLGLLKRMLTSGNRAAYEALFRAGLTYFCLPLDKLLQEKERQYLAENQGDEHTHPLVLVVGPPRSGSTLLYQTLARYADVSYFSNLTSLFSRSPIAATHLLQGVPKQRKNFANYYGQTAGFSSPNDGFVIWNRWLGYDRYITPEVFEPSVEEDMHRFFSAWLRQFGKPFLNKNNRNAFCLNLLARTLPQAQFVVIRREPIFIAQSLITAREQVQGSKHRPWGLASSESHALAGEPMGYVDDVCDQILRIEARLQQQLEKVPKERYVETSYRDFCEDPNRELQKIANKFPRLELKQERMTAELTPFKVSDKMKLSGQEKEQVERRLATLSGWHVKSAPSKAAETT